MKIVIFGASGATGKEVVKLGLEHEHLITAFVRNPKKLEIVHKNLSIYTGDVRDQRSVSEAIQNQDAVLCCLGTQAKDKTNLRTVGTSNIVEAMKQNQVKRLICQTSLGYGDSKAILPWHMKYLIVPLILKNAFKDHESQERIIEDSNLDWTIIRPGNLTNGRKTENYKFNFNNNEKVKLKVSRADVADLIIKQLGDLKYLRKKVGISY